MELFEDIFDDLDYGIADTDPAASEMAALESIIGIEGIYDFSATEAAKTEKQARAIRTIPAFIHACYLGTSVPIAVASMMQGALAVEGATLTTIGVSAAKFGAFMGSLPIVIADSAIVALICFAITSPAIIDSTIKRLERKINKTNLKGDVKINKAKSDGKDEKADKLQTKKTNKVSKLEDRIKVLTYLRDNFRGYSHKADLINQLNKPGVCAAGVNLINSWLRDVGEIEIKKIDRKITKAEEKGKDKKVAKLKAKKMEQESLALDSVLHMCDEDFDPAMESVVEYYFEDEDSIAMESSMCEEDISAYDYYDIFFDIFEDLI